MSTTTKSAIIETMYARKSIRKYDPDFKISREEISEMLTDAMTAPSSSNQQPWRFLVITDDAVKKEIRSMSFNQEQLETSSAIIAVLGATDFYKNAKKINELSVATGAMSPEIAVAQTAGSEKLYSGLPTEILKNVASFDAGLVSMQLMLIAKDRGLDTVAMGGFDKQAFAEKFELPANEFPIILLAIGKGIGPDRGTERLSVADVTTFI
ncbi:nitroreductase family protein [Kurthia sibirica]|uniref:Nitroreductase family protein n=1 Tax=Kurthia sibirica TaxID=202750 RepID=A0A2U3AI79_9BACL|nr:nitroreductase family protein [Kurthia sibirica]PWI24248.1 nitroreductase family protein [Kurthia sibirica]GEK34147.1 NADH oxidase [Kurthia sibirica]